MEDNRAYRLPPCPAYDIATTQVWLEQLAREGLHLEHFTAGVGVFTQGAPTWSRYRLDVYRPSENPLDEDGPTKQAVALAEEFGWEYVCRRGQFAIYRTDDPAAPELHTDRKMQALSLRTLEKHCIISVFQLIVLLLLDGLFTVRAGLLLAAIHTGLWLPIIVAVLSIGYPISLIYRLVLLHRTRKALKEGEHIPLPQNLKKHGIRYQAGRCLLITAMVVLTAVYLIHWKVGGIDRSEERVFLDDFSGQPPFATVADLSPEEATLSRWANHMSRFSKDLNTFARWNGLLAADAIRWEEYRTVSLPDHEVQTYRIQVRYYQLRSEWLAKWLFWELSQRSWAARSYLPAPTELSELPVDAALFRVTSNSYLLRKGDQVLTFTLYHHGDRTSKDCARIFAESLQ